MKGEYLFHERWVSAALWLAAGSLLAPGIALPVEPAVVEPAPGGATPSA